MHAIQNARKAAGLNVEDRIALTLGGDDELLDAVRAHEEYVTGETLATSLVLRRRVRRLRIRRDRGTQARDRGREDLARRHGAQARRDHVDDLALALVETALVDARDQPPLDLAVRRHEVGSGVVR